MTFAVGWTLNTNTTNSRFDFVFPCALENKHRLKNFFALIMKGIDTLRLFNVGMSQNNHDIMATISHSVLIFLLNAR